MRTYTSKPAPEGTPRTWETWTDTLGQEYRAGDYVAIATISGKSPQMVLGRVERINRVDSKGCLIQDTRWLGNGREPIVTDSCTVTVVPLIDARGFWRAGVTTRGSTVRTGPRPVTYQFWQNIVKVPAEAFEARVQALEADLADLLEELR